MNNRSLGLILGESGNEGKQLCQKLRDDRYNCAELKILKCPSVKPLSKLKHPKTRDLRLFPDSYTGLQLQKITVKLPIQLRDVGLRARVN